MTRKMQRNVAASTARLAKLWQGAVLATEAAPQSLPLYRYVASLNETNNVAEARLTALCNYATGVIPLLLIATAVIAMGFVGYAAGVSGANRQFGALIMSALPAFLIVVTQDLSRPDRSAIEVSTLALQDALAGIPAPRSP